MSKWAGKYVIGLTGNIATGKSVVRRMLEHLGAYGIDADALAHRAIARGGPGHTAVVQSFGSYILTPDGEIDRRKLGRLVFNDPEALVRLEQIVHPLVEQAIDFLIRRAPQSVVVIEAIKLMEANLHKHCDSLWVVYAPPNVQLSRLLKHRQMTEAEALQRMNAQPPQERKVAAANVVIHNTRGFEDTWKQVLSAFRSTVPVRQVQPTKPLQAPAYQGRLQVQRGRPSNSQAIADLLNRLHKDGKPLTKSDIMAAFGEKAYLMLLDGQQLKGLIGWQVENLVARATDIHIDPQVPLNEALPALIVEMERASSDLQCEAALIFVEPALARHDSLWRSLGYQRSKPESLEVSAWQDAARESMPEGSVLLFKKLRQERVLRPI